MKTELHHIQRLEGTPPPRGNGASGWTVRWYDGEGRRRVKTFADSKHGGRELGLEAALAFRDAALAEAAGVREARIRAHFIPALNARERRELRARMIDSDVRGTNRHFRVRFDGGREELEQKYFAFRDYASPRAAFRAALRFRERIERMPLGRRLQVAMNF